MVLTFSHYFVYVCIQFPFEVEVPDQNYVCIQFPFEVEVPDQDYVSICLVLLLLFFNLICFKQAFYQHSDAFVSLNSYTSLHLL